jgi:hypothetical protein
MEKKFYVAPEMEDTDLKLDTYLQAESGDPIFDPEPADE